MENVLPKGCLRSRLSNLPPKSWDVSHGFHGGLFLPPFWSFGYIEYDLISLQYFCMLDCFYKRVEKVTIVYNFLKTEYLFIKHVDEAFFFISFYFFHSFFASPWPYLLLSLGRNTAPDDKHKRSNIPLPRPLNMTSWCNCFSLVCFSPEKSCSWTTGVYPSDRLPLISCLVCVVLYIYF